ncbi:MAG: sulfatase-like hydrolase/transferase, partial [Planctomycetota bacterium]
MKYGKTKAVFLICLIGAVLTAGFIVYNKSRGPKIRNVVLISMDTTRSDHLSCYGIYKNVTPNIDALAQEGALFKHMYSPVPLTLPAHSSMLTGVHPPRHGVHDNLKYQLNDSNVTLAEVLKDKGFATGAVISATATAMSLKRHWTAISLSGEVRKAPNTPFPGSTRTKTIPSFCSCTITTHMHPMTRRNRLRARFFIPT